MKLGYARVLDDPHDVTEQQQRLADLGVPPEKIYLDQGLLGKDTNRPALNFVIANLRTGDELIITALDRLARSLNDAHATLHAIKNAGAQLTINTTTYNPATPHGALFFTTFDFITEFEANISRERTRQGMAITREKGKLKRRRPVLTTKEQQRVTELYHQNLYTQNELAELFNVGRSTIQRILKNTNPTH